MNQERIEKQQGITTAERYLARLCERTFLSLWSYPNIFREALVPGAKIGKEVCDLLVVFEDQVLIFSDKDCAVPQTGNLQLDWSRWFRKAVVESAKQAHGAERLLRQFPNRLFLDRECTKSLPFVPQITDRTRFHLIVVAHKIADRCRDELGGSGSLMINSDLKGAAAHTEPFQVGDLDPAKSFVHVLDDTTLNVLMRELDTIADFVAYLDKKEEFLRTGPRLFAAGEEELLSWYLRYTNEKKEHFFKLPEERVDFISLEEGFYEDYLRNPQRIAKVEANEVSYSWDRLIEKFSFHAMSGTQFFATPGGVSDTERILRWMAREPRVRRRMLARKLVECVITTPANMRRTAVSQPSSPGDPYYVYLMIPWNHRATVQENRDVRRYFLEAACMAVRLKCPEALDVVGIATESGNDSQTRSEDAMYLDCRGWNEEMEQEAKELQQALGLLMNVQETRGIEQEYPEPEPRPLLHLPVKVGRNEPCPCGSGKKFKKCHGGR